MKVSNCNGVARIKTMIHSQLMFQLIRGLVVTYKEVLNLRDF